MASPTAAAAHADDDGGPALAAIRSAARDVLIARCMPCHRRSDPGAVAGALAVFDVEEAAWWRRLTADRLPRLLGRLRSAPDDQPAAMARFVDAEQRHRGVGAGE
jgi:hypothetical protein